MWPTLNQFLNLFTKEQRGKIQEMLSENANKLEFTKPEIAEACDEANYLIENLK